MTDMIFDIFRSRDRGGQPDKGVLDTLSFRSMCIAEQADMDEINAMRMRFDRLGSPLDRILHAEWNAEPKLYHVTPEDDLEKFFADTIGEDCFLGFETKGVAWFPIDNWYVLFAHSDVFDEAVGDSAAIRARFEEWLGEWHHSDQGRTYLRALREKYET